MSTPFTHTPGPWMIFNGGDIGSAAVRRPETIVIKSGTVKGETIGEAMKNARLIAAAPELLEALKEIVDLIDKSEPRPKHPVTGELMGRRPKAQQIIDIANAAIAKAEAQQ